MKRNKQRSDRKQRRAERKRASDERQAALAAAVRELTDARLEQMAGNSDDAKLIRHWFFFGQLAGVAVLCPTGVSHDQLRAAAKAELERRFDTRSVLAAADKAFGAPRIFFPPAPEPTNLS